MKRVFRAIAAGAGLAALIATGATAGTAKHLAGGEVCVLLPDTATSIRWVHYDTPALKAALKAAGVSSQFYNADDDAQKQKSQADQCIGNGAKVIIEVALDSGSASAIEKNATVVTNVMNVDVIASGKLTPARSMVHIIIGPAPVWNGVR